MALSIVYSDKFVDPQPVTGTVAASPANTITLNQTGNNPFYDGQPVYVTWAGGNQLTTRSTLSHTSSSITLSGSGLPASTTAVTIYPASTPNGSVAGAVPPVTAFGTRVPYPSRTADQVNLTSLTIGAASGDGYDSSSWTGNWWNDATKFWSMPTIGGLCINPFNAINNTNNLTMRVMGMANSSQVSDPTGGPAVAIGLGARFQMSLQGSFPPITFGLLKNVGWGYAGSMPTNNGPYVVLQQGAAIGMTCLITSNNAQGKILSVPIPSNAVGATNLAFTLTFTILVRDIDGSNNCWIEVWVEHEGVSHSPYPLISGPFTWDASYYSYNVVPGFQVNYNPTTQGGAQAVILNEMTVFTGGLGSVFDPRGRDSTWKSMVLVDNISSGTTYGQVFAGGIVRTLNTDFLAVSAATSDTDKTNCFGAIYKSTDKWGGLSTSVTEMKRLITHHVWETTGTGPYTFYTPMGLWADLSGTNIISIAEAWTTNSLSSLSNQGVVLNTRSTTNGGGLWDTNSIPIGPTVESGYVYGDARGGPVYVNGTIYLSCMYEQYSGVNQAIAVFAFTPGASTNAVPGSMVPTAGSDWTDIASANPFSGAKISTAGYASIPNPGGFALQLLAEPCICPLLGGKLLIAIRTPDFVGLSIGTNNNGVWSWADPFGSAAGFGLCDGVSGRPLIWSLGLGHSIVWSGLKAYLFEGDSASSSGSLTSGNNRQVAKVYESPDGINWSPSALGPLMRGAECDYGFPIWSGGRLLYAQGRGDNQVRLYTGPQIAATRGAAGGSGNNPYLLIP